MSAAGKVRVGDLAPDFRLPGTEGTPESHREHSLSQHRGQPVVLVFYPADDSPVCTVQLTRYTTDAADLRGVGALVLAISPQSLESHDAFAARHAGFAFPLLADVDREVGRSYGILGPLGFYRRSIFVVDPAGIVRYAHRSITSLAYQPTGALVEVISTFDTSRP